MNPSPTDAELQALAFWVREHYGFAELGVRLGELRRAVHYAARDAGLTERAVVEAALRDAPGDPQALRPLLPHVTVGETYFFRDAPLFQALEAHILPEVLAQAGPRPLSIWSAACSTGEEAYSIAVALGRVAPGTHHQILGTDINPRAVSSARAHVYRPWSLRCLSQEERKQWFAPLGHDKWRLHSDIASRVAFAEHNLLDPRLPQALQSQAVDIIFCRNVLIYLDMPTAQRVLCQLISHLRDGGWLVVAAVETFLVPTPPVELVELGDALAFRLPPGQRHLTPQWPHLWPSPEPPAAAVAESVRAVQARALRQTSVPLAPPPAFPLGPAPSNDQPQSPEVLYVAALRAVEEGADAVAANELRKLLFLNPSHILGHVALGRLHRRHGRHAAAERSLRNALRLLGELPAGARLFDGHGQTAGELLAELQSGVFSGGAHG